VTAVQITDHVTQAIARLHEQHKGKTNIEALLTCLVAPMQDIEDALFQLLTERTIDTAIGVQLDIIGKLVGEPRNGLSDDDYRRHVRARISVSRSKTRVADLIVVTRLMVDNAATDIIIDQTGKAAVTVCLEGALVAETVAGFLISFLRDTVAAGVKVELKFLLDTELNSFTLGTVTTLDGAISSGEVTLLCNFSPSSRSFPTTGSLMISPALAAEEVVTYTGISGFSFTGVSTTTNAHADGADIKDHTNAATQGYDDDASPGTGGKWVSVLE